MLLNFGKDLVFTSWQSIIVCACLVQNIYNLTYIFFSIYIFQYLTGFEADKFQTLYVHLALIDYVIIMKRYKALKKNYVINILTKCLK